MTGPARIALAAVAFALLLPLGAMGLQSTAELEQFHNRVLKRWPSARTFAARPARYFEAANAFLADRIYPIVAATDLKNRLAYRLLDTSLAPNVTVSRGGLVFLNGPDAASADTFVARACVTAADPGVAARLADAVDRIGVLARARRTPIDVMVIPTFPALYGDRLPRSLPSRLREACAARAAGNSPLFAVPSVAGTRFIFPFASLRAHAGDLAMFPNGNFHPEGWSVMLARDAYLETIGAAVPTDETISLARGPSELLEDYGGFSTDFPFYRVSGTDLPIDDATASRIRALAVAPFFAGIVAPPLAVSNPAAPDPRGILILSDSFGIAETFSLGAVFRRVLQVTEPDRDLPAFLDAVAAAAPFDRVIILFNDADVERIAKLASGLPGATSP